MNQELTPEQNSIVEKAAKAQSEIEREYMAGTPRKPNEQDIIDSFKAGSPSPFPLPTLCVERWKGLRSG